jgi:hypothetical protein
MKPLTHRFICHASIPHLFVRDSRHVHSEIIIDLPQSANDVAKSRVTPSLVAYDANLCHACVQLTVDCAIARLLHVRRTCLISRTANNCRMKSRISCGSEVSRDVHSCFDSISLTPFYVVGFEQALSFWPSSTCFSLLQAFFA